MADPKVAQANRRFLSGNDAVAWGARLARPKVIAAYPITPQTTVIERLAEWHADGELACEFLRVESEHSALSACMGASLMGARAFTATSSQGLLYMAECLWYASGGRWPMVMMNANRALALPWNIYGDQQDSMGLLSCGWIQYYIENAQEALDMTLQAFAIAEHPAVMTPIMLNLDGFVLTHTYEPVEIPPEQEADAFLPPFNPSNKFDLEKPVNAGFTAGPDHYLEWKAQQHEALLRALPVAEEVNARFSARFGRDHGGAVVAESCADAEVILVVLGSLAGTVREVVEARRAQGVKVGLLKIRCLRPFPAESVAEALSRAKAVGVVEKALSFGSTGPVFADVSSALINRAERPRLQNFIVGLGGREITREDIDGIIDSLLAGDGPIQRWIGLREESNG
jgi:pyruvate ferredoxin oxidoreductase alpha subunit